MSGRTIFLNGEALNQHKYQLTSVQIVNEMVKLLCQLN